MQKATIGKIKKMDYSSEAAYKTLMTQLQFCGNETKAVAISSYCGEEGKTDVAFTLARSFAGNGKNVLFIDADMRNTVFVSRYKVSKVSNGLSQFLAGAKELDEVLCSTDIEGLYAVTSGMLPEEPARLISSDTFANFIQAAREKFDYIIVDTPSLNECEDAALVGKICDGICLVVAPNKVGCKRLVAVRKQLEDAGCEILGVIMNKVKSRN